MKRRRLDLTPKPDPIRVDRLEALLRTVEAYEQRKRKVPGYVLRQIVFLHDCWAGHAIPKCAIEARGVLQRTGGVK